MGLWNNRWEKYRRFYRVRIQLTRQSNDQRVGYPTSECAIWRLLWLENTYLKKILYTDNPNEVPVQFLEKHQLALPDIAQKQLSDMHQMNYHQKVKYSFARDLVSHSQ